MSEIAVPLPTRDQFAANANSIFCAPLADGAIAEFALVKISDIAETAHTRSFSLLFRAPTDLPAVQTTYRLEHEMLGNLDLFLVPVRSDADGTYFESVFNFLKTQAVSSED